MKEKIKDVNGVKIYQLSYLAESVLTDEDISNLLDTPSLKYSVIIDMFKRCNIKKSNNEIIDFIHSDNWFDKYKINKKDFNELENIITRIYVNIFSYSEHIAKQYAQWFMSIYSFKCKN